MDECLAYRITYLLDELLRGKVGFRTIVFLQHDLQEQGGEQVPITRDCDRDPLAETDRPRERGLDGLEGERSVPLVHRLPEGDGRVTGQAVENLVQTICVRYRARNVCVASCTWYDERTKCPENRKRRAGEDHRT